MTGAWQKGFGAAKTAASVFHSELRKIKDTWDSIESKTITLTIRVVREEVGGEEGVTAQHGANFVVPPGFPNDTFPLRVTSGERVIVIPNSQSAGNNVTFGDVHLNNGMDMAMLEHQMSQIIGGQLS